MVEALEFCESLEWPGRRMYVIGEMLELGDTSRQAHEELGRLLARTGTDKIFLYGEETAAAAKTLGSADNGRGRFFHTCDFDELSGALGSYVQSGDLVLLKGSRGCALDRLCGVLNEEAIASGERHCV
jgi:UDP-N-acetylmuramoyl-tripeptide--D-alanyl-D-alanine ligase